MRTSLGLPTAEETINTMNQINAHNYNSYANRSLVMARKGDWDNALDDALRVRYSDRHITFTLV